MPDSSPRTDAAYAPSRAAAVACVLALIGAAAYWTSFEGVFLFDDEEAILFNPYVRQLWPLWEAAKAPVESTVITRPIASLSLAVNYAIHGYGVAGYHVFNLCVHVLASLFLFGVVRRTLRQPRLATRFAGVSEYLAFSVAAIWLVHPIHTGAVTYIVQRVESMMGLFFLATLYASLRSFEPGARKFSVAAIVACLLGVGTKEVMVTAPVVVLLYDAVFAAQPGGGSVIGRMGGALRARKGFYALLFATWIPLAVLVLGTGARAESVGFDMQYVGPYDFGLSQLSGVLMYLKLVFWPHPLIFDYGWPEPQQLQGVLPQLAAVALLLAGAGYLLFRRPAAGFAAAGFFLVLSPSSSIVPIVTEVFAEHRMYVPSAFVIALAVVSAHGLAKRLVPAPRARTVLGVVALLAILLTLGVRTHARNSLYHSKETIWADAVEHRPRNDRAQTTYANVRRVGGDMDGAEKHFREAVRLRPDHTGWRNNLANLLLETRRYGEAFEQIEASLEADPDFVGGLYTRGLALKMMRKHREALAAFVEVLKRDAAHRGALNLAVDCAAKLGDAAAMSRYLQAQVANLSPDMEWLSAVMKLAWLLSTHRDSAVRNGLQAEVLAREACRVTGYQDPDALNILAAAQAERGEFEQAVETARQAVDRAREAGRQGDATVFEQRLERYRRDEPWRE